MNRRTALKAIAALPSERHQKPVRPSIPTIVAPSGMKVPAGFVEFIGCLAGREGRFR